MSKNIGIVCEGPTDYVLLKGIVDQITGEDNHYVPLQPEDNLTGEYGNGWKGVWKWCADHAEILEKFMKDIIPQLDLIIIQMDGDVARKEKEVHCLCDTTKCERKGTVNPLECDMVKNNECPVEIPCASHNESSEEYVEHLSGLIFSCLKKTDEICIVIPCDSTDTWVAAAYDKMTDVEKIEDPWNNIISKKKEYHDIRIPGHKKRVSIYRQFVGKVCEEWDDVRKLCISAELFERNLKAYY
jgi:hypothetical protein